MTTFYPVLPSLTVSGHNVSGIVSWGIGSRGKVSSGALTILGIVSPWALGIWPTMPYFPAGHFVHEGIVFRGIVSQCIVTPVNISYCAWEEIKKSGSLNCKISFLCSPIAGPLDTIWFSTISRGSDKKIVQQICNLELPILTQIFNAISPPNSEYCLLCKVKKYLVQSALLV